MEAIVMGRDVRGERKVMIFNQQQNRTHSNESQAYRREKREGSVGDRRRGSPVIAWINRN
jgi:hypothetical protein